MSEQDQLEVAGVTFDYHTAQHYAIYMNFTSNYNFSKEHTEFLKNYRSQNWVKAKEHIEKYRFSVQEFTLYYTLFLKRIDDLSNQKLPEDWSGVFIAKTK